MIKPFHVHLAQIYERYARNDMSAKDYTDMFLWLKQNCDWVYAVIKQQELSYLAHATDDVSWQREICSVVDKLFYDPNYTGV